MLTPIDRVFRVSGDIFSRGGIVGLVASCYFDDWVDRVISIELKRVTLLNVHMDHIISTGHFTDNTKQSLIILSFYLRSFVRCVDDWLGFVDCWRFLNFCTFVAFLSDSEYWHIYTLY